MGRRHRSAKAIEDRTIQARRYGYTATHSRPHRKFVETNLYVAPRAKEMILGLETSKRIEQSTLIHRRNASDLIAAAKDCHLVPTADLEKDAQELHKANHAKHASWLTHSINKNGLFETNPNGPSVPQSRAAASRGDVWADLSDDDGDLGAWAPPSCPIECPPVATSDVFSATAEVMDSPPFAPLAASCGEFSAAPRGLYNGLATIVPEASMRKACIRLEFLLEQPPVFYASPASIDDAKPISALSSRIATLEQKHKELKDELDNRLAVQEVLLSRIVSLELNLDKNAKAAIARYDKFEGRTSNDVEELRREFRDVQTKDGMQAEEWEPGIRYSLVESTIATFSKKLAVLGKRSDETHCELEALHSNPDVLAELSEHSKHNISLMIINGENACCTSLAELKASLLEQVQIDLNVFHEEMQEGFTDLELATYQKPNCREDGSPHHGIQNKSPPARP